MNKHATRHYQPFALVTLVLVGTLMLFGATPEASAQQSKGEIGFVIASNGTVTITSKTAGARPASLRQDIFLRDVIKTGPNSTTKILFDDNTILNVTEDSEIAINEYVYDPATKQRRTVFNMLQGRVKAVVSEFYATTNSRFEIRTPSAVAAAHGTEYVVWTFVQNGQVFTGIAVTSGAVTVTGPTGQPVTVSAGQFTIIGATTPPTPPALTAGNAQAQDQVNKGDVKTDSSVIALVNETMAKQEGAQAATAPTQAPPTVTVTVLPITKCTVISNSGNTPAGCTP